MSSSKESFELDTVSSATRTRLLEVAMGLLCAGEMLDMTKLALAAGCSRQGIYLHFRDASQLMIELARYSDEKFRIGEAIALVHAEKNPAALLKAYAKFLGKYNPKLYPSVRMADALRVRDERVQAAWMDRLHARQRGCRSIARKLHESASLHEDWNVQDAGDWLAAQSSIRIWEELVQDLGWSAKRYAAHLEKAFVATLLR